MPIYEYSAILRAVLPMVGGMHGPVGGPAASQQALIAGFAWLLALLVAVVLMTVAIVLLRRYFRKQAQSERASFTLDQLRRLRDRGNLTESEYLVLRGKALLDA